MRDMIQRGADRLRARLAACAGRTVSYARGEDPVDITATVGATVFEAVDEYGVTIERVTRDYIVAAADLILDGAVVLPMAGDVVTETIGGVDHFYQVVMVSGEQAYRAVDPSATLLRIHTQETGAST